MLPPSTSPKVYVIIVTWRNANDAIECLDSLLQCEYDNFTVVVCDNNSTDGTLERIRRWAAEPGGFGRPPNSPVGDSSAPPSPIPVTSYDRATAERGGNLDDKTARLILIQTGANLGYAGGNNVGIRYAQSRGDADYFWLLNSDTVVPRDCISQLVSFAAARPEVGLIGSPLVDYDDPSVLQAFGGATWDVSRAEADRLGEGAPADSRYEADRLDAIVGVSMLATRGWIEAAGLLEERYFLYCEEIDWATRGRHHLALAVAPDARVFHKKHTTGKSGWTWRRWYYFQRARLLFTAKFYPQYLPNVFRLVCAAVCRRLYVVATYYVASRLRGVAQSISTAKRL